MTHKHHAGVLSSVLRSGTITQDTVEHMSDDIQGPPKRGHMVIKGATRAAEAPFVRQLGTAFRFREPTRFDPPEVLDQHRQSQTRWRGPWSGERDEKVHAA